VLAAANNDVARVGGLVAVAIPPAAGGISPSDYAVAHRLVDGSTPRC
jgi:hypothetical protein